MNKLSEDNCELVLSSFSIRVVVIPVCMIN
jgi:hypothetical protein